MITPMFLCVYAEKIQETQQRKMAVMACTLAMGRFQQYQDIEAFRQGLLEAIQLDPTYGVPMYNLAVLAEKEYRLEESVAWLEKFLKVDKYSEHAALAKLRLEKIKKIMQKAKTPQDRKRYRYNETIAKAKSSLLAGEIENAVSEAIKATQIDDSRFEAYCIAASALLQIQSFSEAVNLIKEGINRIPQDGKEKLKKILEQCQNEEKFIQYTRLGNQALQNGEYARAAEELTKAWELFKERGETGLSAAMAWASIEQYAKASKIFSRLAQSSHREIAKKAKEKLEQLTPILEPIYEETLKSGISLLEKNQIVEASEKFQNAIYIIPDRPEPYFQLACIYAIQDKEKEALEYLRKAVINGLRDVGKINQEKRLSGIRTKKEFRDFLKNSFGEKISSIFEAGTTKRSIFQGMAFLKEKKFSEAISLFHSAIEADAQSPELYYRTAWAYALNREKEKALSYLKKAFSYGFKNKNRVHFNRAFHDLHEEKIYQEIMEGKFSSDKEQKEEAYGYGLTEDVWQQCSFRYGNELILDMTGNYWLTLPIHKQIEYATDYQAGYAEEKGLPLEKVLDFDGAKYAFSLIPPGRYWMGSPSQEEGRENQELLHIVVLSKPYYMGKYEVTKSQWNSVMGNYASSSSEQQALPVEKISWQECQEFCRKAGRGLRLPTEAEWEYACRAGSTYAYCVSSSQLNEYAWYSTNSSNTFHLGGQKNANSWGCYDMHGNLWEWCLDYYRTYSKEEQINPLCRIEGPSKVLRGGSYLNSATECRSAQRIPRILVYKSAIVGFRLCMDL